MDGSCPRLHSNFGDPGSDRAIGYLVPKLPLYKPSPDTSDLGYHTLDNSACRSSSSTSIVAVPIKHQHQQQPQHRKTLSHLDDDLLLKIFGWLTTRERCTVAQTCRRLREIVWHPSLWHDIEVQSPQCITTALNAVARYGYHSRVHRLILEGANGHPGVLASLPFPRLTTLALRHLRRVNDDTVAAILDNCMHLRELDLTGCAGVTRAYTHGASLQLQSLDMSDCHGVDDAGLALTISRMPHLACLYLRRCARITDASLVAVTSYCGALRQLSVSDCARVTDFGIREVAARLGPSLRYLSVGKCDRVSDAGLLVVARHCYKLRYLNARGCEALSDSAMLALARSCPRMRAFDLGKCDIGDATLEALSTGCPNLKKLSLRGCERVSDVGLEALAYYVRGLRQLNIGDCPRVTCLGYRAVKRYCRRCVIEHTNPGFSS